MKNAKRWLALAVTLSMLLSSVSCGGDGGAYGATLTETGRDEQNHASLSAPIPLSGFEDVTGENGTCTYAMTAEFDDTYTASCDNVTLTVKTDAGEQTGDGEVTFEAKAGERVTLTATGTEAGQKVAVTVAPKENAVRLPYQANFTVDPATLDASGNTPMPDATVIEYNKRKGGTYVYLNNPEKLQPEDVGQAILRDEGLSGDVQVTWEHSNFTGQFVLLGYQLKNDGDKDAFVTVQNIGYQTKGEWLGQQSWSDYYNMKFELPEDYFAANGVVNQRYVGQDFIDYTPRVYHPVTYRIPAGKYIYVLGGSSSDAFNRVNVADTANRFVPPGHCTNAVAKMFITGEEVTGTFYCYTDEKQVQAEPEEQGYIVKRDGTQFGLQYKGVDYVQGLIESNPVFYIDDDTSGTLPVTFTYQKDRAAHYRTRKAYDAFKSEEEVYEGHSWNTNINPQGSGHAVGTDMSSFECVTTKGETVVIDTEHSDGTNAPANLGNWMIDYHDNMTFVNQGDKPRTVTINKSAQGALMTYVADRDGKVLKTKCTIVPLEEGRDERHWKIYEVELPPHSVTQFTVSFLLMGNSYGNVGHWVSVE
ncbi:MAG: hypothetical protein IJD01_08725 [Clostridia bacterium]|nr:hypothetical protein [Clostridia bacterium]